MSICKWCGIEVPKNMCSYHSRTCMMNPDHEKNIAILKDNARKTTSVVMSNGGYSKYMNPKFVNKERNIICPECGSEFKIICSDYKFEKRKYKHYCSRTCANKRVHCDDTKIKISESLIKFYDNHQYDKDNDIDNAEFINRDHRFRKIYTCGVCGKKYNYVPGTSTRKFCSKECSKYYKEHRKDFLSDESIERLSDAGKKSAFHQRTERRSKNEKLFCNMCEKEFDGVLHNVPLFNGWDADVILTKQKIAVLWNGKWHYENIMKGTSLEQIQNRDKIKIQEIKNAGYTPYIIKDYGKYNQNFVEEQFNLFKGFINDL